MKQTFQTKVLSRKFHLKRTIGKKYSYRNHKPFVIEEHIHREIKNMYIVCFYTFFSIIRMLKKQKN